MDRRRPTGPDEGHHANVERMDMIKSGALPSDDRRAPHRCNRGTARDTAFPTISVSSSFVRAESLMSWAFSTDANRRFDADSPLVFLSSSSPNPCYIGYCGRLTAYRCGRPQWPTTHFSGRAGLRVTTRFRRPSTEKRRGQEVDQMSGRISKCAGGAPRPASSLNISSGSRVDSRT